MDTSTASTFVTCMEQWRATITEQPLAQRRVVMVRGELIDRDVNSAGPAQLLLPYRDGPDPGGFATITGWLRSNANTQAEGRPLAELTGRISVQVDGALSLQGADLRIHHQVPGPYQRWRGEQMTRLGLGEGRPGYPNLPHVQQEITQLLDASRSKQVIWLGRCGRAYKDAITTERGTRDEQIAALLTPVNLPMQGQQAKQKIIDYLATVRDDVALIVVARGGGDEGDLSLFEDAEVLEALRACPAKTLAAVGHANDDLLINRIANWKVNVPKSIHGVLSPHAHGRSTIRQDRRATDQERASRATAQERASRLANQLTDCKEARRIADLEKRKLKKLLDQSEQERRSQTATAVAAEMRHLDQLANAARRRITSSYSGSSQSRV